MSEENKPQVPMPTKVGGGVQSLAIPISIVIAGGFIAAALFFSGGGNSAAVVETAGNQPVEQAQPTAQQPAGSTDSVKEVTKNDHIKGNPDAPVKIVEYSDMECPFCKRFHDTLNEVMAKYGDSGEVAWVFRQFPLDQLHPKNARKVAVVSECATEQGGNDMFWKFTNRWFELTATNDRTDLATVLPQIYDEVGLDVHLKEYN